MLVELSVVLRTCDCGHNRESPPSFYNGIGTIYVVSSRGRTLLFLLPEI